MKVSITVLTIWLCISCSSNKATVSHVNNEDRDTAVNVPANNKGITVEVVPDTFSAMPEMMDLVITNHSTIDIQYGAGFQVEKFNTTIQTWEKVDYFDKVAVIAIMYFQPAGETKTYPIALYPDQVNYEKGRFRIKKSIYTGEESQDFYAGFVLQ